MSKTIDPSTFRRILYSNRFALFFFAYAVMYNVVIVNRFVRWEVDDFAVFAFYAADFSFGFTTKLLPGAIYRIFFGSPATRQNVTVFMTVVVLLFFAFLAVLLQKIMYRMPEKNRTPAFYLLLLFLSGAYTFAVFTKTLGLLDTFWLLFTLPFFFVIEKKKLRFLIPLLFALTILVHNVAIITYAALMSLVLLYRAVTENDKKERRSLITVLVLSLSVAAAEAAFFTLFETKLICPISEFHEKLTANGSSVYYYYDYAFYGIYDGEYYIPNGVLDNASTVMRLLYSVWYRLKLNARMLMRLGEIHPISFACALAVLSPIFVFFSGFHAAWSRAAKNMASRLCAALMILLPICIPIATIPFSEDLTRWFSHSLITAFVFVLCVVYYSEEGRKLFFERFSLIAEAPAAQLYFLAYWALSIFTVY